jgi:methyl-accepting chemotaxis protein
VLGNQICTPITKLAEHAKVVATGKIDTDISRVSGTNELAVLQNSFCDMIDNFKSQAEVINRVASGDLCVDVNVKSGDDVVGNALAKLVNDNNEVFTNVQNVANEIREGSSHIAAASQHLAQGSTEQASAIEQITASVTGIANQSRTNAAKVDEVRHIILEAGQHTADGNEKMKEMVTAMNEINASSHNIQKVIKVMNDIAFNTNILALNASVEASRAGAQGKGFAVVAEEVRNLAEHSAEAAGKIEEMIADSLQKVSHGSELVEDTEKALELISASIGQITDLSNDVAEASEEQAEVAGQIDEALQQVSSVVQMNSAASEQCAASSEELSNQANELNHQLAQFQLKGDRFY